MKKLTGDEQRREQTKINLMAVAMKSPGFALLEAYIDDIVESYHRNYLKSEFRDERHRLSDTAYTIDRFWNKLVKPELAHIKAKATKPKETR